VIKPAISAGSFGTQKVDPSVLEEGQRFLESMLEERDMMIQPYVESVDHYGERALVSIDGELTHAVRKSPRFSTDAEQVSAALPIADDERALAMRILMGAARGALYGRVDLARDERGAPMVMELELIEPSLFLLQHPAALSRLARAILSRAQSSR
jgi:hypothetical protein